MAPRCMPRVTRYSTWETRAVQPNVQANLPDPVLSGGNNDKYLLRPRGAGRTEPSFDREHWTYNRQWTLSIQGGRRQSIMSMGTLFFTGVSVPQAAPGHNGQSSGADPLRLAGPGMRILAEMLSVATFQQSVETNWRRPPAFCRRTSFRLPRFRSTTILPHRASSVAVMNLTLQSSQADYPERGR